MKFTDLFIRRPVVATVVNLIILLAFIGDIKAYHAVLGHRLTAAQVSQLNTLFITLTIVFDLVPIALWMWMARANGQGRNWARSLSTVLFGLATLEMTHAVGGPGIVFGGTVFSPIFPVLTWLVGLVAVWLLWCPASSAFFKPQGFTQTGHRVQPSSRIRSPSSRVPRQL